MESNQKKATKSNQQNVTSEAKGIGRDKCNTLSHTFSRAPASEWNFVVLKNEANGKCVQNPQQMVLIFNKVSASKGGAK